MAEKKRIDELFKKKFENLQADAPAGSWENISERLQRSKRRKRAAYWRWASTAAAVVVAFMAGYYLQPEVDPGTYYNPRNLPVAAEPTDSPDGNEQEAAPSTITMEDEKAGAAPSSAESPATGKTARRKHASGTKNTGFAASTPSQQKGLPMDDAAGIANVDVPERETGAELAQTSEEETTEKPVAPKGLSPAEEDSLRAMIAHLPTDDELNEIKKPAGMPGSFRVSAHGGPALSFRNVQMDDAGFKNASPGTQNSGYVAENVDKEKLSTSLSAGVDVAYRGNNRLEYLAGVYLTSWQQHASGLLVSPDPSSGLNSNTSSFESSSSLGNTRFSNTPQSSDFSPVTAADGTIEAYRLQPDVQQEFRFVEIPLGVNYYLMDQRKWTWSMQGGVSARILAGRQSHLVYRDGREVEIENPELNKLSLQLQAGTGVGYRLSNDLQLNLMPLLRYGVTPVNNNAAVTTYFHQIMIYSGLSFEF